ncbi:PAS domain-containing sensor histidine kinase [Paenibacillus aceris]|uniref:histidine kinase n=1 Tax=Paenibacillus aceris TaxID=869555 RepID=A0ABS4HTA0_9BACL|nr:PAS domain-containing sensor histidine kinase [Paenibacillus aceris]MBP1961254.1 PAS domain S-box-containing protein [Paenibacillus aceris]NHW37957.1 PAS domain S-box protein [Paenibacillus aceris]
MDRMEDVDKFGLFILSESWQCIYVNDFAAEILNRTPEALVGKNVWVEFPAAMRNACYEQFHKAVRSGEEVHFEEYVKSTNQWLSVSAFPFGGNLQIALRKLEFAEISFFEDYNYYYKFIEHTQDLITLTSKAGIFRFVSPAVTRLLGYEVEEFIGINIMTYCHPEDIEAMRKTFTEELSSETAQGMLTCRFLHKRGGYIWFEKSYKWMLTEEGERSRKICIWRDITERKQIEAELKRSKANLEIAQEIAGLAHYDWDVIRDELFWSDELFTKLQLPRESFNNRIEGFMQYVHPDEIERVKQSVRDVLQIGSLDLTFRMVVGEQDVHIIHTLAKTTYDQWGRPLRVFGIVQDITLQKQTEELLRKTEKLKVAGQLAAGIAHEIRNPLTALKGFAKLMCHANEESKQRYYQIMKEEFNRIELILGELLILAKPQVVDYRPYDTIAILNEVIELLNTQAIMNNVLIEIEFESGLPYVKCERNQLKQVFVNVIKNAIEAMPAGGSLQVSARMMTNGVAYVFVDQGLGISEERLPRIGEPFYTTKEKGTGLGLMVSFAIIDEHQGHIEYQSKVGVGTTVLIELPACS